MTDELKRRQKLDFLQAEGLEELPRQFKRDEMPRKFRAEAWAAVYQSMDSDIQRYHYCKVLGGVDNPVFTPPWDSIAGEVWVSHFCESRDEFPRDADNFAKKLKSVIMEDKPPRVYALLQALLRSINCPPSLREEVADLLRRHRMAYYLDASGVPTFVPVSSEEEAAAVRDAMRAVAKAGMGGAREHLRKAAEAMTQSQFADAVRESIHAAESAAMVVAEDDKLTLSGALKKLKERGVFSHPALADAFIKLYGYAGDEKGVRHALLEKNANVGEDEALLMFGACASFCGYLSRKQMRGGAAGAKARGRI